MVSIANKKKVLIIKSLLNILLLLSLTCQSQVKDSTLDQKLWFQTRLNNLHKGDTLHLPSGVFLTSYLNVNVDDVVIVGHNTTLKMAANSLPYHPLIEFWGRKHCTLTGIKIDMNNMTGSIWKGFPAIQVAFSSSIRILNDSIYNNKYIGVRLFGGDDSITVANCVIINTDTGIHANGLNSRLTFILNTIIGGTSEGITIGADSRNTEPHDFLVTDNYIKDKNDSWAISVPYGKKGLITRNTVEHCRTAFGLGDKVSTRGAEGLSSSDISIINNKFSVTHEIFTTNPIVKNQNIRYEGNVPLSIPQKSKRATTTKSKPVH